MPLRCIVSTENMTTTAPANPVLFTLGIAQDGGVPHIGTHSPARSNPSLRRTATCLGIADPATGERWLLDATPDIKEQLALFGDLFNEFCSGIVRPASPAAPLLSGIALTHAHVGHYLGLAWLGKEMLNTAALPVYAMPGMAAFLSNNLPWSALVARQNILLHALRANVPLALNSRISLIPLPVPHRDEHSETIGFRIVGPNRSVLFIPDIDRWEDWDAWGERIEEHVAGVDLALLDGTFFSGAELPGRDMAQIPHPTVASSVERFRSLPEVERCKIRFIHLNHSNPLLNPETAEYRLLEQSGCGVAGEGDHFFL